jgi:hypothetical protein
MRPWTRVAILLLCSATSHAAQTADAAFQRLRQFEGKWHGTMQWIGIQPEPSELDATYSTTGADSAVVENLIVKGKAMMTSVYHLDGNDLRMTHYCAAGNQPRLKASRIADAGVDFSFVDATNIDKAHPGHVEAVKLRFVSPDQFTIDFTFGGDGKQRVEHIELKRVKS